MNKNYLIRSVFCVLAAALAACSSSDDSSGGGLLGGSNGVPTVAKLTLVGPSVVAPGVDTSGFVATLSGATVTSAQTISFAVTSGSINTFSTAGQELPNTSSAKTGADGTLDFNYQAPTDVVMASSVTITATAAGFVDSTGAALKQTLVVAISPATFEFIAPPLPNSTVEVGSTHAAPLNFQWTQAANGGTVGVAGNVNLSVSNGGVLVVNGNAQNGSTTSSATVATLATNNGNFSAPVSVFNDNGGFTTITATNPANVNQTATLTLQFIDVPASSNLVANPLTIPPATSTDSISQLTYTVDNDANQPISGVDVVFTLINATNGTNERLFPLGGTTDDTGAVTSKYYAGDKTGTVTIQACVKNTNVCDTRQITISSSAPSSTSNGTGTIALAGPKVIGQHQDYSGYTATLTDSTGAAVANTFVNLTAKPFGVISAPPGSPNTGGAVSDSNGQITFSYRDDNQLTGPTTIAITSSAVVGSTTVNATPLSITLNPDGFAFSSPANNATIKSGTALVFSWTRDDASGHPQPVSGGISLTVSGSAGGNPLFVAGGAAGANPASLNTDGTGGFSSTVQITDTVAETVTVTATDLNGFNDKVTSTFQITT